MEFIADRHIHSRYSRATSPRVTPENLWRWGQLKGTRVIGTGDCTHPDWLGELEARLEFSDSGLLTLQDQPRDPAIPASCRSRVSFLPSSVISCSYRRGGRTREVHCPVYLPDFAAARRLNGKLARIGNLASNG